MLWLASTRNFPSGDQLMSCPLLICDGEDFSLATKYVDSAIGIQLANVFQVASESIQRFFFPDIEGSLAQLGLTVDLDAIANSPIVGSNVSGLFLETCTLAARITKRTLECLSSFEDPLNEADALALYDNTRFIGLKAWTGLPYIYVWV